LNLLAQPRRARVDVVGADAGDARAAQPTRDIEPGFAETDKADPISSFIVLSFLNTKG
jgi:hypothetical protein